MLAKFTASPCKPIQVARASRRVVVCQASSRAANQLKAAAAAVLLTSGLSAGPALANGVAFANIASGSTVASPVHLEFSVQGLSVKPAAEGVIPGTGHYHLIIDAPGVDEGTAIPFDDLHKHYGKGQTSAELELPAGTHTLTLQFANAVHESYGPAFTSTITLNVQQ